MYFFVSYSCHLLLGDVENAQQRFKNCFETGAGVCLDRRIIIDAADGQRKAQVLLLCSVVLLYADVVISW